MHFCEFRSRAVRPKRTADNAALPGALLEVRWKLCQKLGQKPWMPCEHYNLRPK
jgi:hypothetical protein